MQIKFEALVREVKSKSLVSGDKSYRILLEGIDPKMMEAMAMPSDREVRVMIEAE